MKRVLKYELIFPNTVLSLPYGAKFLKANWGINGYFAWFEVSETTSHTYAHAFQIFGTGAEIPNKAIHLETFFEHPLVWHLYEMPR